MKLVIAGSRDILTDSNFINECLLMFRIQHEIKEVVSGGATGVDAAGEEWAIDFLEKEAKNFPADWAHGASAGPARNKKMAEYADALLLIWDGKSSGSANMKSEMLKRKKPVYEIIVRSSI